jgi:hypothetical protein
MSSYCYDSDNDSQYDDGEIDIVEIKRNILSNMHHLIFCDLTTGRSDNNLEPYDSQQVNDFIEENHHNIQMAASLMFSWYEDEDDLHSLKDPEMDWDCMREFLYRFVSTRTWEDIDYNEQSDDEFIN